MSTPSRELLIVSPERWDEACFSVPAVRALAGSGLGIGVLCQAHQKAFWETLPNLPVHTPSNLNDEWQVALVWEPGDLLKLVRKAGIQKRLGPNVGKLAKQRTETLKDSPHPTQHRVQYYLTAVEEMGVATAKPEFFTPAELKLSQPEDSLLLVPDSDFGPSHEWSLQKWQVLAHELMDHHALTIGQIDDGRNMGEELAHHLGRDVSTLPIDLDGPELERIASHRRVITADGSLPHLASHLGATCITLFGPNDPTWKRPLGKRHQVVHHHVECAPCFTCSCPMDMRCQKELEISDVMGAFKALSLCSLS